MCAVTVGARRYHRAVGELSERSAVELRALLRERSVSVTEVVAGFLERIDQLNPELGAFCAVDADRATAHARDCDRTGDRDPELLPLLWGMPFADKDLSDRAGEVTGHGSRAGRDIATVSSPEVLVLDAAGGISLGRSTASEFGLYGYTSPLAGPVARNPHDYELGAGGSSGGAAAAVAAHLLPFAPGSDGGGSIRIPAASVGIVGVKPSREYLAIDRGTAGVTGVVNGALARSVGDAALLLDALAADPLRPANPALRFSDAVAVPPRELRIGFTADNPWRRDVALIDHPESLAALMLAAETLEALGHRVIEDVRFPQLSFATIFQTAWQRAAASIDLRFNRSQMEPLTQLQIAAGEALTDEDHARNDLELETFALELERFFSPFDAVMTPTLGMPTHRAEGWSEDLDENFLQQVRLAPYSSWVNVAGLPAVTLPTPVRVVTPGGHTLPVSVQLIGRRGRDVQLIALAAQCEAAFVSGA